VTRPILETEGLTKRFGSLVANDRLSVTVEEDTIHGIMGPNGSGKSTFFNTVTGFYRPDGGTVRFDGEDVTGWKPDEIARRGLARTFQIRRRSRTSRSRRTCSPCSLAGFARDADLGGETRPRRRTARTPRDRPRRRSGGRRGVSGGQEKLLELGRILMLEPACVMLDEPTAGSIPRSGIACSNT